MHLPKRLPIERVRAGTRWMRIHHRRHAPLWFGPGAGLPPVNRFDDPLGRYRVCYVGSSLAACFAETFLRNPPMRFVSIAELSERTITTIETTRVLRIVPLHGPGLVRVGATAEVAATSDYEISQAWSAALWEHRDAPDGIAYRSRHDDASMCVAIYDRAREALSAAGQVVLTEDAAELARIVRRYGVGLSL